MQRLQREKVKTPQTLIEGIMVGTRTGMIEIWFFTVVSLRTIPNNFQGVGPIRDIFIEFSEERDL
jgi:hypothetical protein